MPSRIKYPPRHTRESRRLLRLSTDVAVALKQQSGDSKLRIRRPARTAVSWTDGWFATIGKLAEGTTHLEIWLDRYSGHRNRKLWVGFHSAQGHRLRKMTERVHKKLWPRRIITNNDVTVGTYWRLTHELKRSEFNLPILEQYDSGDTYFGLFESNRRSSRRSDRDFVARATAFFGDVVRTLRRTRSDSGDRDIYPQLENRKLAVQHLIRERSRLLATECKIRDNYTCQVCAVCFERKYGRIGKGVVQAHHRVPLSRVRRQVKTQLRDLITVCANCHRMLHNMQGKKGDVGRLTRIVRRRRNSTVS